MTKKSKYNRRRAIDCKIIEKSESNPGYYKYMVSVAEKDGTTTNHPVYGKDMQNALKRLMNQEKTNWFERKLTAGWIFALWLLIMGGPTTMTNGDVNPYALLYSFGTIAILFVMAAWWNNYITKGK